MSLGSALELVGRSRIDRLVVCQDQTQGYIHRMVSLTKILDSRAAINGTRLDAQVVRCPHCEETYRLEYGEGGPPSERLAEKGGNRYNKSHKRDNHKTEKLKLR